MEDLPLEILSEIFTYLDARTKISFCCTINQDDHMYIYMKNKLLCLGEKTKSLREKNQMLRNMKSEILKLTSENKEYEWKISGYERELKKYDDHSQVRCELINILSGYLKRFTNFDEKRLADMAYNKVYKK